MRKREVHRGLYSILGGLILWEALTRLLLENELLIPPPSSVIRSLWRMSLSGDLNRHLLATLFEFASGFSTACIVGIVLGYLMGRYRWFDELMDPWIATLYSIPVIAFVPLIIIWFGIELTPKIIIVLLTAVIDIIINTYTGVINVGQEFRMLGMAFCVPKRQIWFKILLPGSLPYIVTGLRLATSRAIVGVVVAEYFGSSEGLGWLLFKAMDTYNMPLMISCATLLAGTGIVLNQGILAVEKIMAPWRDTKLQE